LRRVPRYWFLRFAQDDKEKARMTKHWILRFAQDDEKSAQDDLAYA